MIISDERFNYLEKVEKAALHTVLSLQESDAEYSAGFSQLKDLFQKQELATESMRDWTQFKPRKIPVEFLVPVEFLSLLIKELKDCDICKIRKITDDTFKYNPDITEQESVNFGKIWINQEKSGEDSFYGEIYIQISANKYIEVGFST